jgi:hypothetical protein
MINSVVFSRKMRDTILSKKFKLAWDVELSRLNELRLNSFMYKTALCKQIMEDTENRKYWKINLDNPDKILHNPTIHFWELFNYHQHPEPAHTIFYSFAKIIYLLFVICILFCLYNFTEYLFSGKRRKKNYN